MEPEDTESKEHDELVDRGRKMVGGIKEHAKDELPARLNPTVRQKQLDALKQKRAAFTAAQVLVGNCSKEYQSAAKQFARDLAQDDELVRGHYGKSNVVVKDFGTTPISTKRAPRKSKKADKIVKPE